MAVCLPPVYTHILGFNGSLPLMGFVSVWLLLGAPQELISPGGEMGFAKDVLSKECVGNSQEFNSYRGRAEEGLTCLPSHPCLTCDAADVPSANCSPLLTRAAFILAAICLQTEMLTRSSSPLAAAVPLRIFLFQRGFLSF